MAEQWHEVRVFLEPGLYELLHAKSVESGRAVSELVSDAVREALARGEAALVPEESAASGDEQSYEDVLKGLEARGQ